MGYIVFGDDDRMNGVRTLLAAENSTVPVCVFAPNVILTQDDVKKLPWGARVYAGGIKADAETVVCTKALSVFRYGENEEFVADNAEITAEAVLSLILNKADRMLREQKILIVGFGKCGRALSKYLFGLAADFDVMTAKRENEIIYATAVPYGADISCYDVIINTAPSRVISEGQLDGLKRSAYIVDIASLPYGLNHGYAVDNGIDSAVYPALPARSRPYSAARAMVRFILEGSYE